MNANNINYNNLRLLYNDNNGQEYINDDSYNTISIKEFIEKKGLQDLLLYTILRDGTYSYLQYSDGSTDGSTHVNMIITIIDIEFPIRDFDEMSLHLYNKFLYLHRERTLNEILK